MIDDSETDAVVEAALHAFVAQRCQRAHAHHLRNGLQAIYASVDVLQRIADGKAGPAFSIDRVRELVRKALRSHEQSINDAVKHLTVQQDERAPVELAPLVRELISFINSDAAAHEVVLQDALTSNIAVLARPSIVRLMVLATLARCIDALRGGGQVSVDAVSADSRVAIEFTLRAGQEMEIGAWEFDSKEETAWNLRAMRRLMASERGLAESHAAGAGEPSSQKIVRLIFQAAPVDNRESTEVPSAR
jgi:hypothetical protein